MENQDKVFHFEKLFFREILFSVIGGAPVQTCLQKTFRTSILGHCRRTTIEQSLRLESELAEEEVLARKKRFRYADIQNFGKVLFPGLESVNPLRLSPSWQEDFLPPDREIILELGCGKGEYCLALAERYPEKFFIGVDVKSDRLWVGANSAIQKNLPNVLFIRARVDHLAGYFPANFADGIWLPFPDPIPGNLSGRKRLTSPRFIEIYRNFLKPGGFIRCKTDHEGLYDFTLANLSSAGARLCRATPDLHTSGILDPDILYVESHFEKEFRKKGFTVKFMEFVLE